MLLPGRAYFIQFNDFVTIAIINDESDTSMNSRYHRDSFYDFHFSVVVVVAGRKQRRPANLVIYI